MEDIIKAADDAGAVWHCDYSDPALLHTDKAADGSGSGQEGRDMIKIRVTYEHPGERKYILDKFSGDVKRVREQRQQERQYKRIYIELPGLGGPD